MEEQEVSERGWMDGWMEGIEGKERERTAWACPRRVVGAGAEVVVVGVVVSGTATLVKSDMVEEGLL